MAASGSMVDPTKPEKFRVVIGDELLGKSTKEVFTGVRYNHRPAEEAPGSARITPSKPGSGTFDLAFREPDGTKYSYNGTRAMNDGQYVLVFDPNKRTFVLHKLDSLFNMNLVGTPDNDDPAALKKQHPFLSGHGVPRHLELKAAAIAGTGKAAGKAKPNTALRAPKKQAPKKKEVAKKPPQKPAAPQETMVLPQAPSAPSPASPQPQKQKKKEVNSDDEDDEDSDDGLEIVYTDSQEAKPRANKGAAFSPPFSQPTRRFSEFIKDHNDEDDEDADADGEPESDHDVAEAMDEDEPEHESTNYNEYNKPDQDDFGDLEEDLEAALEQELAAEESDVSEED
ncbi:hypothetical protein MCOR34_005447 [Pyricularia oryzae]|nr:hypothetical protein MCOR34_005447 [Pyricularia oryzae]